MSEEPRGIKGRAAQAKAALLRKPEGTDEDTSDLIGESKQERPNTKHVSVPVKVDRNLLTRTISGFIYVLINFLCIICCPLTTALCMSVTAGICSWEFFRMMMADAKLPLQWAGILASIALPLVAYGNVGYVPFVIFLEVLVLGLWYVIRPNIHITDVSVTLFGSVYTGLTLCALVCIRGAQNPSFGIIGMQGLDPVLGILPDTELTAFGSIIMTLGVMASVWANDAFAYLFGCAFGKHKMAPTISPKKSWEGFAGGLAGSCVVWLLMTLISETHLSPFVAIIAGLLCGVAGVMGDLVESRIKRGAGVKDSGNLIPGHGGMLDRSDSMLFVSITAYFILRLMGVI